MKLFDKKAKEAKKKKLKEIEKDYSNNLAKIQANMNALTQQQALYQAYNQTVTVPNTSGYYGSPPNPNATQKIFTAPGYQWNYDPKWETKISFPPTNHLNNYKDREGFKWLDKNEEWAMVPADTGPLTATEIQALMQQSFVFSATTPNTVTTTGPKKKPKIVFLHRHDDDLMMGMKTLNSRYHGPTALICEDCDKPVPDEYRMMYALQNSLSDKG
jgi:hypothetical protein